MRPSRRQRRGCWRSFDERGAAGKLAKILRTDAYQPMPVRCYFACMDTSCARQARGMTRPLFWDLEVSGASSGEG